jgi:3-oxoacyl-[acyl-carrier-protein] synthase II
MRPRVAITGLGMISSAGANLAEAREKFVAGTCCLSEIRDPRAARLKARFAGLVSTELLTATLGEIPIAQTHGAWLAPFDRHVHLALVAAHEALVSSGLRPYDPGRRMGLIFSTCSGPMLLIEEHYERLRKGDRRLSAAQLFAKRYHAGAAVIACSLGIRGFTNTVVTACSAGTAAMAIAADLIRCGVLDAALAGGADAFAVSTLAGFDGLKATSEGKCAPFSKPYGLNLGEGAAFVVLERASMAEERGATIRAEVLGSGMSNDAYHCSAPEPGGRGLAAAMQRALRDAGLNPEQIGYVNAHGTGTEANDKAECKAARKVFGERAARLPMSSTKSLVGHCLGAAGAIEAVASLVCAEAGVLPPTANFTEPREGCAIDCVPQPGRAWPGPRVFLSNNSAFGGHNASLVLSQGEPNAPASPVAPAPKPLRIVVTACGLVTPLGLGLEALAGGQTAVKLVNQPGLPPLPVAFVDGDAVERFDRRLNLREMDRSSRWATVAARLALRDANFPLQPSRLAEMGLYLSLSTGPSWAESEYLTSYWANNGQVSELMAFPYIVTSSVAGNVCRELRLSGPNLTLNGGPGAGLLGLPPAVAALRNGQAPALLCGAVDELSDRILTDLYMAGELTAPAPPPGEGAAVLMLETEDHARARGANLLASVEGMAFGLGQMENLRDSVHDVLAEAGIEADQLAAVCAPDTNTAINDVMRVVLPYWYEREVSVASRTGWLEGAQPLVNLAAALKDPRIPEGGAILVVSRSDAGVGGAVVFKKLEMPPARQ